MQRQPHPSRGASVQVSGLDMAVAVSDVQVERRLPGLRAMGPITLAGAFDVSAADTPLPWDWPTERELQVVFHDGDALTCRARVVEASTGGFTLQPTGAMRRLHRSTAAIRRLMASAPTRADRCQAYAWWLARRAQRRRAA